MTKIFLSHSSQHDTFAGHVREAVRSGLAPPDYDVFVDMDHLQPGEEWRSVLYHELAVCDAAVVLLNREALASPWVRREVIILLWRRALGSPLRIVPALLGDVRTADVKAQGFSELEPLQFARITSSDQNEATAKELANKILQRFAGLPAGTRDDSAMRKWACAVATYLREVKDPAGLVDAARVLGVEEEDLDRVRIPQEGCRFLAHQLIARAHGHRVEEMITAIYPHTPAEWLGRLIDQIRPAWVDAEAARGLLVVQDRPRRTAVLNARSDRTAQHYVQRATCCALSGYRYATVAAVTGAAFDQEFLRKCREGLVDLLDVPAGFTLEEHLPLDGEEPPNVCFLFIDPQRTALEVIARAMREVQDMFPWLTMVLLTGDTTPARDVLDSWDLAEALVLSPELGPREELQALSADLAVCRLRKRAAA